MGNGSKVLAVSCAVVAGTTMPTIAALRTAIGTSRATATTITGSAVFFSNSRKRPFANVYGF